MASYGKVKSPKSKELKKIPTVTTLAEARGEEQDLSKRDQYDAALKETASIHGLNTEVDQLPEGGIPPQIETNGPSTFRKKGPLPSRVT